MLRGATSLTEAELEQKLDELLQAVHDDRKASIALRDAILQQTQALYSLAAALAGDDDEPVQQFRSLADPVLQDDE